MRKTEFIEGEGLKIPVFDLSIGKQGGYLSEPETKRNSLLELLFTPQELETLMIVKINPQNQQHDPLKRIDFGDNIPRRVAFSSGQSIYFADAQLSKKLNEPFKTQPDHACRYGSLLVSSCNQGAVFLDSREDGQPLRLKIVDSASKNPQQRAIAQQFQTGDCHGKISPRLAKILGGKSNCPFQFRFAWLQKWDDGMSQTPKTSFLAKGTFLPDPNLTDKQGYDIILDRSSIKGIDNSQLDDLIPCGDYQLPQAVLGNRGNAKTQDYENSWQMSIWYSENALKQDLVPSTLAKAQKLAQIQNEPLKLAQYLVQQHDQKAKLLQDEDLIEIDEDENQQRHESRMISLLRNDSYGQLLDHPKIADFMRSQLANQWRDLAIKGAVNHGSAMAQPCDDLQPGTIIAPHLRDGEEVIVTRYPIVSKDNIRRYTVDNSQKPELLRYRGCVFIRSDQAMQHHQCDFDGDQLVITPASRIPHIAAETRHANEANEYQKVQKRPKIAYTQAKDSKGRLKYTKLRQIAVAVPQNSIGYIATLIGRVQSSVPHPNEPENLFKRQQRKLLGQLFDALQIEVDSPKSATRFESIYPHLIQQAKQWTEDYPSYLFDFKKDPRLYKTIPLPTNSGNAINVIAREAVNPVWSATRIRSRHRHEFRYLFPQPSDKKTRKVWENHYLPWAKEIKERVNERGREIHQLYQETPELIKQEYGKLYEDLRGEIAESFPKASERKLAAAALWYVETTNPNLNIPRQAGMKLARKLQPTFELREDYQRRSEALQQDTYVLNVPFVDLKGHDLATSFKESLERKGIAFEATLHPTLPMVQFALLNPSQKIVEKLEQQWGDNDNSHLKESDLTYYNAHLQKVSRITDRIVPPTHYTWLENDEDLTPKSALVLNLFTEEIAQQLKGYQFSQIDLIGQKYNDFAKEDFRATKWQDKPLQFTVQSYHKPGDPLDGKPIVALNGRQLAMFSVESPKLPIGATFTATIAPSQRGSALTLNVDPESVMLPQLETEKAAPLRFNLKIGQSQSNLGNLQPSQVLLEAISEKYAQKSCSKLKIQDWTAFINSNTQECFVKNQERELIFRANLATGEIIKPLDNVESQAFVEKIQQFDLRVSRHKIELQV